MVYKTHSAPIKKSNPASDINFFNKFLYIIRQLLAPLIKNSTSSYAHSQPVLRSKRSEPEYTTSQTRPSEYVQNSHTPHPRRVIQHHAPRQLLSISDRVNNVADDYNVGLTGKGVTIFIVDNGVLIKHTEFSNRASGPIQNGDHGTKVASVAAGKFLGVAKDAEIRSYGSATYSNSDLLKAMDEIITLAPKMKPTVMVLPWGPTKPPNAQPGWEKSHQELVNKIEQVMKTTTVVASAPNEAVDACNDVMSMPKDIILVGGSKYENHEDRLAPFSSHGKCIDIIAPATDILVAKNDGKYVSASGNSFSAPLVAGVVAQILQKHPDFTHSQVKKELLKIAAKNHLHGLPPGTPNLFLHVLNGEAPTKEIGEEPEELKKIIDMNNAISSGNAITNKIIPSSPVRIG